MSADDYSEWLNQVRLRALKLNLHHAYDDSYQVACRGLRSLLLRLPDSDPSNQSCHTEGRPSRYR
jgi:hypothetical protein